MSSGIITTYLTMRRDSRLVVTGRPRERRASHALCVKHRQRALYFAQHSPLCGRKLRLYLTPLREHNEVTRS